MKKDLRDYYSKIETNYWWFTGMSDIFSRAVKALHKDQGAMRILDVGCGTGIMSKCLEGFGCIFGLDKDLEALKCCKKKDIGKLVLGRGNCMPFGNNTFDLIAAFNIVEHLDKDSDFIKEVSRVCKDKGRIILATSAFNFLWSAHDIANEHKRRYTKESLKKIISRYFMVEKITYTNFFLFPFIWLGIVIVNLRGRSSPCLTGGFYILPGFINKSLELVLKMESRLLQKISFPFGVSLLCVAKKV